MNGRTRNSRITRSYGALAVERLEGRRVLAIFFVDSSVTPGEGTGSEADPFGSIQDAVDAAAASAGDDSIQIAEGVYTENIDIEDSDQLTVEGVGDVTIQANDAGEDVIKAEGDLNLKNLTVTGGDRGVDVRDGVFVLDSVTIVGNDSDGVRIRDGARVTIQDSYVDNNGSDGIDIEADDLDEVGPIEIKHTNAINNGDEGLEVDDAESIKITGGTFSENSDEGLDIDDVREVHVTRIIAEENGGSGLQVEAQDTDIAEVIITRSLLSNNDDHGIEVAEDGATVDKVIITRTISQNNGGQPFAVDANFAILGSIRSLDILEFLDYRGGLVSPNLPF